jgi:hypothetical protein
MGNMSRTCELKERELDPDDPWNELLQACSFDIRSTFHTIIQAHPVQLIIVRDTIHDIRFQANWNRITNNKQKNISSSNKRENLNRIKYNYKVGDRILIRKPGLRRKLPAPKEGPYTILEVGTNGMVKTNIIDITPESIAPIVQYQSSLGECSSRCQCTSST